eukprot:3776505-Amphidinium_carterae.1
MSNRMYVHSHVCYLKTASARHSTRHIESFSGAQCGRHDLLDRFRCCQVVVCWLVDLTSSDLD